MIPAPRITLPFCVTGRVHWPLPSKILEKMPPLRLSGKFPPESQLASIPSSSMLPLRTSGSDGCRLVSEGLVTFPPELRRIVIEYCPPEPSENEVETFCFVHILGQLNELNEFMEIYRERIARDATKQFVKAFSYWRSSCEDGWVLLSCLPLMRESRMFRSDYRKRSDGERYCAPLTSGQVAGQLWYLFHSWFNLFF